MPLVAEATTESVRRKLQRKEVAGRAVLRPNRERGGGRERGEK